MHFTIVIAATPPVKRSVKLNEVCVPSVHLHNLLITYVTIDVMLLQVRHFQRISNFVPEND